MPKKSIEEVTVWICPSCLEEYEDADDAKECCFDGNGETRYLCPECGEKYHNDDEARECCR